MPQKLGGIAIWGWASLGGLAMVGLLYATGVLHLGPAGSPAAVDTTALRAPAKPGNPTASPATSASTAPTKPTTRAPTASELGDPTVDTLAARRAIEQIVERFRRAIESGRIDQLVRAVPALTDRQQHDFEGLFARAQGLQVELVIDRWNLDPAERRAEVQLKGFFRYRQREGGGNRLDDYKKKANLAFGPTGWRLTQLR